MTSVRTCQKHPPCPTEWVPARSKTERPISGGASLDNAFKKEKEATAEKQLETEKTEVRMYE